MGSQVFLQFIHVHALMDVADGYYNVSWSLPAFIPRLRICSCPADDADGAERVFLAAGLDPRGPGIAERSIFLKLNHHSPQCRRAQVSDEASPFQGATASVELL